MIDAGTAIDWATAEVLAFGIAARRRARPSGSPARTAGAARSASATRSLVDRKREGPLHPAQPGRARARRLRRYRQPAVRRGGPRLRVRLLARRPARWFCGRPSSATSPTAPRSSSTSSSPRAKSKWQRCQRAGAAAAARLRGPGAGALVGRLERFLQLVPRTTSRCAT